MDNLKFGARKRNLRSATVDTGEYYTVGATPTPSAPLLNPDGSVPMTPGYSSESWWGWLLGGLLLGVIVATAIFLPILLTQNNSPTGSNEFSGLGENGGLDNTRSSQNNKYINSGSVVNLNLKCKFDVAALENRTFLEGVRIMGPLSILQSDNKRVYGFYGSLLSGNQPVQDDDISGLFAVNRADCSLAWHVKARDISTQAAKILLEKFPGEYDPVAVENFVRPEGEHTCFGPIALQGDYIFTGDGCSGNFFFTDNYYASLPQANGGPILGKTWGVTTATRHWLHGQVWVINKANGKLAAVDRVGDAGEEAAQGYVNPFIQTRMMTPFVDPVDGQTYVITTVSHGARQGKYTRIDDDESRVQIGILNENREVRKGGCIKKFLVEAQGGKIDLKEVWRYYGNPPMLFAGDTNPYNITTNFTSDEDAEQRNYHGDGIWAQRPLVDLELRQVVISGGNGLQIPAEIITAARTAMGTTDPATGAQGYPGRSYRQWYLLFNEATSVEAIEKLYQDFVQTQKDSVAAALAISGSRLEEYAATALVAIDIDTGARKWYFRKTASDTWFSLSLQAQTFSEVPLFNHFQYLGGGGDHDYGMGPIKIKDPATGKFFYVCLAKDGSIQAVNAASGEVLYSHKLMHSGMDGGFNYQASFDGRHIYAGTQYTRGLDFLGDKNHDTQFNTTSGEPFFTVIEQFPFKKKTVDRIAKHIVSQKPYRDLINHAITRLAGEGRTGWQSNHVARMPIEMPDIFGNISCNWYTNELTDTFNDKGGGAGQFYNNLESQLEFQQGTIVKIDAYTGKAVNYATRMPASGPFPNGNALVTTVNDVVLASSQQGQFQAWDAKTLTPLWTYDVNADVTGLPGYPSPVAVVSNPPIAVGNEVWATHGEFGFWGNYPGKYLYCFDVPK